MSDLATLIANMLLSCGFPNVFPRIPSTLDCAEPIVVVEGSFARESRQVEEERGDVAVTVMVVREVAADAEAVANAAERAMRKADWEPYANAGSYRIVGIDSTAPHFEERDSSGRDSSGRSVWAFEVVGTVVRSL